MLTGVARQLTIGHIGVGVGVLVFGLTGVVQRTLEPAHVSVWISRRGPGVS